VTPADEAAWDRSSAVRLRFHWWLVQENLTLKNLTPSIQIVGTNLEVASAAGIRHISHHHRRPWEHRGERPFTALTTRQRKSGILGT
jgi:hypothetical protein